MKICGIYKITNIINGKVLIGQSTNVKGRWSHYRSRLRKHIYPNIHFQKAWDKYGEQSFNFEIIMLCAIEKLSEEEIRLIRENKSNDRKYGYNLTTGGDSPVFSEEARQNMKKSWNYDKHFTEETKRKISQANSGKTHTEETKRKISKMKLGKRKSQETKQKMSKAKTGTKWTEETKQKVLNKHLKLSEETKQKISKALKGENNPLFGKRHSEETKQKISKALKGGHLCLSEEDRARRRKQLTGANNPMFNKGHSEKTKRKMKEAWKIRKLKLSMPQTPIAPTPSDLGLS